MLQNVSDKLNQLQTHLKFRDKDNFLKNYKEISTENLLENLNDESLRTALGFWKEENKFMVHKLFSEAKDLKSVLFVQQKLNVFQHYKVNDQKQTWLHVAVISGRSFEIIDFLHNSLKIPIDDKDEDDCVALHYLFWQPQGETKEKLQLLMGVNGSLLSVVSRNGVTPLELACNDKKNLDYINEQKIQLEEKLKQIDKIEDSFKIIPKKFVPWISCKQFWFSILTQNDKDQLLGYMKNTERFGKNYILETKDFNESFLQCPENGEGVKTLLRKKWKSTKIKDIVTIIGLPNSEEYCFYRSSVFLSLITGRWELILPLIKFCQFDIIPFCLLTCIVCSNLRQMNEIPENISQKIKKVKEAAEAYAMETINRASQRDLNNTNEIIFHYLRNKKKCFGRMRILDLASLGTCQTFFTLPVCQKALSYLWKKNSRQLRSPFIKYVIHSIVHIIFLLCFASVLFYDLGGNIGNIELACYVYTAGYFVEEVRQMIQNYRNGSFRFYIRDFTNYIELMASALMGAGFTSRLTLSIPTEFGKFIESQNTNLFVIRILLCISFILFSLRLLYFLSLFESVGPKLKMLETMIINDLAPILYMFFIFICCFGLVFQSLLFPNSYYVRKYPLSLTKERIEIGDAIGDILRRATYSIFDARYLLDELESGQSTIIVETKGKVAVYVLLLVFIVIVNVTLLNLLIALFSYTVTMIVQQSKECWKASRWQFITEYRDKSFVPPPLNILQFFFFLLKMAWRKSSCKVCTYKPVQTNKWTEKEILLPYHVLQASALKGKRLSIVDDKDTSKVAILHRLEIIEQTLNVLLEKTDKALLQSSKQKINQ